MNVIDRINMKPFEAEARFFKLLMHPARLEILDELRKAEACVCHLEAKLGYRQAYISQHIMVLREAGVIQDRREGWNIFYHVTKPEIFQLVDVVSQLMGASEKSRRAPQASCPCPKCNSGEPPTPCSKELAARTQDVAARTKGLAARKKGKVAAA
jgi:DNA-binding transcriptional ArsR family regulator